MADEDLEPAGPASNAEELFDPHGARRKPEGFLDPRARANDPQALRKKAISDKQRTLNDENDLRTILSTEEGVRFVARLIAGPCGWNLPHFHASNSVMCEVAGRRSIAYQLEQWISDVDVELWFAVRRELEKQRPKPKTSESKSKPGSQ